MVPVVFTEASIAEGIVLPPTSGGCGAARLLDAAPLVGVEGDTCCLVAVGACRDQQQESGWLKGQPSDGGGEGDVEGGDHSDGGDGDSDASGGQTLSAEGGIHGRAVPGLHG